MTRGLAWDDQPKVYLNSLALHLGKWGVELVVVDKEVDFAHRWQTDGPWDFVVTDLVEMSDVPGGQESNTGVRIAQSAIGKVPVYLVTERAGLLEDDVGLPGSVILKSKSTLPVWMAKDILDDLERQGIHVNDQRVFIIYGHDSTKAGLRDELISWLERRGVIPNHINPANLKDELLSGLITKMQSAAAFIAICTPDDPIAAGRDVVEVAGKAPVRFQPRQNVLLEIGMVLGMRHGMQRLIILKAWGKDDDEKTTLPSDLAGLLSIKIEGQIADHAEQLRDALRLRGVKLTEPSK